MQRSEIAVSVVITSYNQKGYLIDAVESVINQMLKPHEILIADDCSCDGSINVVHEYMDRFPEWIKGIFQKENVGIPKNRNAALKVITGSHVSILDGDDLFRPDKIEREVELIAQSPETGCVYSNVRIVDSAGRPLEIRDNGPQPSGNIFAYIAKGKFGLLRSMLIDYSLLKEVGFMDEALPKYDGFDLTMRLGKKTRFAYVQDPLLDYRVHPASDSRGLTSEDHLHDLERIYRKMFPMLSDVDTAIAKEIYGFWNRLLFSFRLKNAKENNKKGEAISVTLKAFCQGAGGAAALANTVKWAFPEKLKKSLKQLRSYLGAGNI